jgi:hypothetical protein
MVSPRRWLDLGLPDTWMPMGPGTWHGAHGSTLSVADVLESVHPIESSEAVEAHEAWCERHHLNAQQTRMEETEEGVTVLRSFGETQSDDFLLVAHLWKGGRLSVLCFRVPLESLADEDLADVLGALLEARPMEEEPR